MRTDTELSPIQLALDCEREVSRISETICRYLRSVNRTGLIVAVSGGIDSSVVLSLAVQAVGRNRVLALLMPDKDSSPLSLDLGRQLAGQLGVEYMVHDITSVLSEVGCYVTRDEAISELVPGYSPDWKWKIVISPLAGEGSYRFFSLVVQSGENGMISCRLTPKTYLAILAATNFKQRVRKMFEYFHADRLNYAVAGTPNRLEYDQGFFVKLGDGAADIKPIAHLYKSQVYQLGRHLGLPDEICSREPTTDTYSLGQSQEEFYFSVPYQQFDLCLFARNHGMPPEEVARVTGLENDEVKMVFQDIDRKRKATRYLHLPPALVEPVPEVEEPQ